MYGGFQALAEVGYVPAGVVHPVSWRASGGLGGRSGALRLAISSGAGVAVRVVVRGFPLTVRGGAVSGGGLGLVDRQGLLLAGVLVLGRVVGAVLVLPAGSCWGDRVDDGFQEAHGGRVERGQGRLQLGAGGAAVADDDDRPVAESPDRGGVGDRQQRAARR